MTAAAARDRLTLDNATHQIVRLDRLAGSARLPFSLKVLLENLQRNEHGRLVTAAQIWASRRWPTGIRRRSHRRRSSSTRPRCCCRTSPSLIAGLELLPGTPGPARLLNIRRSASYLFLRYWLRRPSPAASGQPATSRVMPGRLA